jgi:hypothetical protein
MPLLVDVLAVAPDGGDARESKWEVDDGCGVSLQISLALWPILEDGTAVVAVDEVEVLDSDEYRASLCAENHWSARTSWIFGRFDISGVSIRHKIFFAPSVTKSGTWKVPWTIFR